MWEAIASLAWTALAALVIYRLWPMISDLLRREGTTIKVGSFELTISEATQSIGKDLADLQRRLAMLESKGNSVQEDIEIDPRENQKAVAPSESIRKSLIWVDDFPSNNAFLIDNFRKNGFDIVLSVSTSDALEKLKSMSFGAAITDLGRIENGIENPFAGRDLIREMRSRDIRIPVLVFAGQRGLRYRGELIEAGAEEVTSSGVDVTAFVLRHFGKSS